MKLIKSVLLAATLLGPLAVASTAEAQPGGYYSQPANTQHPGGFHNRNNRLIFGFSLMLGTMKDNEGEISGDASVGYSTLAGGVSAHIGGFVGPRLALMAEVQGNAVTLSSDFYEGDTVLVQSALMGAAQYWVTPQLWIKGGIGFASLDLDNSDYYEETHIDSGMALMGAVGFELLSAQRFSVDLQGRLLAGSYDGIDQQVTSGSIGVGINWF
jgi:hypothetical protein